MKSLTAIVCASSALIFSLCALGGDPKSVSNAKASPSSDSPSEPPQDSGGDPVGYIDGNVYESVVDLRVPCPDIDLVFRRAYGSWSMEAGTLGYGWAHGYEWSLSVSNGSDRVVVRSAGEDGPTDAVHTFDVPPAGGSVFNADGYCLALSPDGLYTLTTPSALSYAFNGAGRLASLTSWNGTKVTLERASPDGPVTRAVHDNGMVLGFEYGADGSLVRVTTPDPGVWVGFTPGSFAYTEQTSLPGISASVLRSLRKPVLLSAVRHDGASASTNVYVYTNSPPGVRIVVPPPTMTGERDGVRIASQPPPREESVTEGTRPLLSEKADSNGLTSRYWYVRPGDSPEVKCLGMEMSGGLFRTDLEYASGRTTERKPIAGGVAEMVLKYDAQRRETERRTGAETWTREYGLAGSVARERIANADTGAFVEKVTEYDARFRPVSVGTAYCTSPFRFTTLSWDDRRNIPSHVVTPEGRVSEWTTNGHDVVVYGAGTNDVRAVTAILCDATDRPYAIVSPDGGRIDCAYDDRGYLSRIAAEDLPPVAMAHDALGRVSSMTLPGPSGDRVTSFTRNWRGKPLSVAYPDGTAESFAYNGDGTRVTRHVDALGREDAYQWTLGLPIHAGRVVAGVTNALFRVEHDEQLNVVAIVDPLGRNAETYVLDGNERVVAVTNVEGQVLERTYAVERLVSSETRFDGTAVSYAYDADANLASAAYPDETLAFTYDGDGLRTSASNSVGVVTNEYDAATGWLASSCGADGTEVSYVYSDGGEVTGVVSVAGTTRYALDKASRRTRIESPAGTMRLGYCAWNGNVSAVTNGNGMVTAYAYDVMDRVTNIAWTAANGTSLGGFTYAYDAVGRIVSRGHTLGNSSQPSQLSQSSHTTYAYDALDRLASDGGVAYTYDAAGNRMTRTENGETVAYALDVGDRLASWTGGSYTYNAAGCVTRIERDGRPALDLTWNGQYQLVSVSTNGVFAESYAYDALGRRVSTTTQEGTVRHVYDDSWQCIADIDENGNVLRSYVWGEGIDKLLAVSIGGNVYYPLTDIQGTVWGYVDSQNNVVARWTYDAWGNVLSEFCAVPSLASVRYRFQGREWSAVTGLINFRFRWYDPVTGRWISKDTIGLSGGLNLYLLSENSPINICDPSGLARICIRPLGPGITGTLGMMLGVSMPGLSSILTAGNKELYHAHIFFDDGTNIGYCEQGLFDDSENRDWYIPLPGKYDDDLMKKIVDDMKKSNKWRPKGEPNGYSLMRHNCQNFTSLAVKTYFRRGGKRKW